MGEPLPFSGVLLPTRNKDEHMTSRLTLGTALALCLSSAAYAETADFGMKDVNEASFEEGASPGNGRSPVVLKAQVLLDRAGISPGVIDSYYGENVRKALASYEEKNGLPTDGELDADVWDALTAKDDESVLTEYEITEEDVDYDFVEEMPEDYSKLAEMDRIGFKDAWEMFGERFHMDQDLLKALNPDADVSKAGTRIVVAAPRERAEGKVTRIEVSNSKGEVRAYDDDDQLVVFYPATIGSEQTPSPSGTVEVEAIAIDANYTYNPDENFTQGDNTEKLILPPGPNNPIGTIWIDLSKPTYGIHGTPEPAEIDKTYSHGCVRLTNWDVDELAHLVEVGATVEFKADQ